MKEKLAALLEQQTERLAQMNIPGTDVVALSAEVDAGEAEMAKVEAELRAIETLEERVRSNAARQAVTVTNPHDRREDEPFESLGDFMRSVVLAGRNPIATDPRLHSLAAAGHNETVDSEGGFLVGKDYAALLFEKAFETGVLAARARVMPISSNSNGISIPSVDETSRANGSRYGGIRAYWIEEAGVKIESMAKFRKTELKLKKLVALTYATDELLQDAAAMEAFIMDAFPDEMGFALDDAILYGTGAGTPLGIFAAGGPLVPVPRDSAQTPDTIVAANIAKMMGRMPLRNRRNAVWFMNAEVEAMLPLMTIGNQPVYMPPGGMSGSQYGTLLGRPVVPIEQAAALGDVGDIMLFDMTQYLLARKGGIKTDRSIHVKFITDETAFRFVMRVDGAPRWSTSLTPYKGTGNLSPFVTLAAR